MTTSYVEKVRRTASSALIGYWPFNENDGTTAWDWGKAGGRNGTSSGVIPADKFLYGLDGGPVYKFAASTYVSISVTALLAAFSGAEGTLSIWCNSLNYADSTERTLFYFRDAASNDYFNVMKYTDNKFYAIRNADGAGDKGPSIAVTGSGWKHLAMTWSEVGDYIRLYIDGVSVGTPASSIGTYVDAPTVMNIGAGDAYGTPWVGWLQHAAIWNIPIPASDIVELAEIGP